MSKSDFMFGLDQLKVKLQSSDVSLVFEHLDKNKDGFINYQEFCGISEEKRNKEVGDALRN
jgi:Ca2+-binding EF-hand superfamily protein